MIVRLVVFDAIEGEEERELELGEGVGDRRRLVDFRESFRGRRLCEPDTPCGSESGAESANGSPSAGAGSAADKSPSAGAGSAN